MKILPFDASPLHQKDGSPKRKQLEQNHELGVLITSIGDTMKVPLASRSRRRQHVYPPRNQPLNT